MMDRGMMRGSRHDRRGVRRFRPYPEYQDSGVEWMSGIPSHWETKVLKRQFRVVNGSTPKSGEPDYWDGDIPWVTPEDLGKIEERVLFEPGRCITRKGYESCGTQLVPAGTLVLSTRAPIGHLAIAGTPVCTNQGCRSLVFRDSSSKTYFYFQVRAAKPVLEAAGRGSTFMELASADLESVALVVPPLEEQRDIANFLDRETVKIDALVAKKERLIELLQEKRTALITRAVTRGIDPNAPMKDSGIKWLGAIPAHWTVKRLRHLVRHIEQGWSPECENREADADEWGVLKAGCVNQGAFVESENKALPLRLKPLPSLEIKAGDVLMSRASGSRELVGSVAVVRECRPRLLLCDKVFRLHTNARRAHRHFIGYALNSRLVRWQIESVISGGGGLASNISQEAVKDLVVVEPPKKDQRVIANYLDRQTSNTDALIAKVQMAITLLHEYRTALISAAVTGKIDIRAEAA